MLPRPTIGGWRTSPVLLSIAILALLISAAVSASFVLSGPEGSGAEERGDHQRDHDAVIATPTPGDPADPVNDPLPEHVPQPPADPLPAFAGETLRLAVTGHSFTPDDLPWNDVPLSGDAWLTLDEDGYPAAYAAVYRNAAGEVALAIQHTESEYRVRHNRPLPGDGSTARCGWVAPDARPLDAHLPHLVPDGDFEALGFDPPTLTTMDFPGAGEVEVEQAHHFVEESLRSREESIARDADTGRIVEHHVVEYDTDGERTSEQRHGQVIMESLGESPIPAEALELATRDVEGDGCE